MRRRGRLILAACSILAAAPAAAQPGGEAAVSAPDYPAEVRVTASEYQLSIRYRLAPDGSVSQCEVARSSGQPAIDAETCRIFRERGRLRPERGRMGGTWRFRWLGEASLTNGNARGAPIPLSLMLSTADYPAAAVADRESGTVAYEADISENGVPRRCTVTQSSGSRPLDRKTCEVVMTRGIFIPASNGAGGRMAGVFRSQVRWTLPGG